MEFITNPINYTVSHVLMKKGWGSVMQTMFGHILLKQRTGEENDTRDGSNIPFQTYVPRGELVSEIPAKDRISRKDGSPSHNYRLHNDPAISLYDDGSGVCPLQGAELDYLKAIHNPTTRIVQYLDADKMKWIVNLKHNDNVFFRLKLTKSAPPVAVKGKIRYYGHIKGHTGVMFGIEILVSCSYNFINALDLSISIMGHLAVCNILLELSFTSMLFRVEFSVSLNPNQNIVYFIMIISSSL